MGQTVTEVRETEVFEVVVVVIVQGQSIKEGVILPPEVQIIYLKDTNIGAGVTDTMTETGQGQVTEVRLLTHGELEIIMMTETIIVIMTLDMTDVRAEVEMHILKMTVMTTDMMTDIGQEVIGQGQGVQEEGEDNNKIAKQHLL